MNLTDRPKRESPDAILAKNLVVARLVAGVTQQDLASAADISRATIAQLEAGYSDPRLSTIVDLSNALNIPPMLLLMGVAEAQAIVDLPEKVNSSSLNIPKDLLARMREQVNTGMLKDRLRAARLGASIVNEAQTKENGGTQLDNASPAEILAAVLSAIIPGRGTVVGAALGSLLNTTESHTAAARS